MLRTKAKIAYKEKEWPIANGYQGTDCQSNSDIAYGCSGTILFGRDRAGSVRSLQINPFKEITTSFLIAAFLGLIGIATVLVLLNVATSVSLIADAKIADLNLAPPPTC